MTQYTTSKDGTPAGPGMTLLAPAKVNLALHVTGKRDDGYHLLDSLVVFGDFGDRVTVAPSSHYALEISGPRAAGLGAGEDNLCLKAARMAGRTVSIHLEKHLPFQAGLGGGSSDAAAVLRAISQLSETPVPGGTEQLGADVPVCLEARAARMKGIGEQVSPVSGLPALPALLVNPGVDAPTPAVFRALERPDNPGMGALPDHIPTPGAAAEWLSELRNDLEPPARIVAPVIGEVIGMLEETRSCLLARMSGSGATCFALYPSVSATHDARDRIMTARPEWWLQPCILS